MEQQSKGFLFVASKHKEYVNSARLGSESIKDYWPEAHTTLVVPESLYDPSLENSFDLVISGPEVPDHHRTKLWALTRTPYDVTAYVDADMECQHEDVCKIFDTFPDEDADLMITKIRAYNGKIASWPKGEMIYHGGFFVYKRKPHVVQFMQRWWDRYLEQTEQPWMLDTTEWPIKLRPWDQFAFWWLMNVENMPLDVRIIEDDARWNFVNGYREDENKDPIIFYHHTLRF